MLQFDMVMLQKSKVPTPFLLYDILKIDGLDVDLHRFCLLINYALNKNVKN